MAAGTRPGVSELFPNVQFIVTTHSPLIVGGMDVNQVFRFVRENQVISRLELEPDATMGRADEVLTGEGFGLDTTVDKQTQAEIKEYRKLLGKKTLNDDDRLKVRRLEESLAVRLPLPQEGPVERRALEFIESLLRSQIGETNPAIESTLLKKG